MTNDIVVSRLENRQNVSPMTTHSLRERVEGSDVSFRENEPGIL